MFDFLFNGVAEATTLVRAIAVLVAVVAVVIAFLKTRALVPVLITAILGGFVIWVTTGGATWFGERIEDDADRLSAPPPATAIEDTGGPVVG